MKGFALKMRSMFGNTYVCECESTFSVGKLNLEIEVEWQTKHLDDILQLATN